MRAARSRARCRSRWCRPNSSVVAVARGKAHRVPRLHGRTLLRRAFKHHSVSRCEDADIAARSGPGDPLQHWRGRVRQRESLSVHAHRATRPDRGEPAWPGTDARSPASLGARSPLQGPLAQEPFPHPANVGLDVGPQAHRRMYLAPRPSGAAAPQYRRLRLRRTTCPD